MRGAFYVTTALLIANSIQTAADSNQPRIRPTSHHDGVVPRRMDTESSPKRYLRGSREQHDDLALSAADEERMPEPSTRIIGNSLTPVSEEVFDFMRKAAHSTFDLNAPPEEIPTGALEAYNILQNNDPRTYTANHFEISKSPLSKKRTAQALTSPNMASSSAIPKENAGHRPKKPRINVPLRAKGVQSSIDHGKMTHTSSILSKVDVEEVHTSFLEYLQRNSAKFEPREDETKSFIGMVNRKYYGRPGTSHVYNRYIEKLMRMRLKDLKKLVFDSTPVPEESLKDMLTRSSEEHKEIQLRLLRLLRLKRYVRMYRDFFDFCLSDHKIARKFDPQKTLGIELEYLMKNAQPRVSVDSYSTAFRLEKASLTNAESEMFGSVVDAVEKANLSEADKKAWYEILDEIYRDDDQLTPPVLSNYIADVSTPQSGKRSTALPNDVLKTPLRSDTIEWLSRRQKIFELLKEATVQPRKTKTPFKSIGVKEGEMAKVMEIRKTFIEKSKPGYQPTLEMTKKMWNMSKWDVKANPRLNVQPGKFLKKHVSRMDRLELEEALGNGRAEAARQSEAGQKDTLELQTDYLVMLLETYDKFFSFCQDNRSVCEVPHGEPFTKRGPKKETITSMRRKQLLDQKKNHQETL